VAVVSLPTEITEKETAVRRVGKAKAAMNIHSPNVAMFLCRTRDALQFVHGPDAVPVPPGVHSNGARTIDVCGRSPLCHILCSRRAARSPLSKPSVCGFSR
jgi:hypothetical protein